MGLGKVDGVQPHRYGADDPLKDASLPYALNVSCPLSVEERRYSAAVAQVLHFRCPVTTDSDPTPYQLLKPRQQLRAAAWVT